MTVPDAKRNGFTRLPHAQVVIDAWRREYNGERPKKALGGITPSAYARQLAKKAFELPLDFKYGLLKPGECQGRSISDLR